MPQVEIGEPCVVRCFHYVAVFDHWMEVSLMDFVNTQTNDLYEEGDKLLIIIRKI